MKVRANKVETQNLASHKGEWAIYLVDYVPVVAGFVVREMKGCAIDWGDYMSVIAEFIARETQDFASLLGWRRWVCDDGIKDDIRSLQK